MCIVCVIVFFIKQMTAYELRISYWSSDVCSSDLLRRQGIVRLSIEHPAGFLLTAPLIDEDVARRLRFVVRPIGTVDVDHHALARIDPFIAAAQDAGVVHKGLLPRGLFAALAEEWSHREPGIGRAPCRERVCQYVEIPVVAGTLK